MILWKWNTICDDDSRVLLWSNGRHYWIFVLPLFVEWIPVITLIYFSERGLCPGISLFTCGRFYDH